MREDWCRERKQACAAEAGLDYTFLSLPIKLSTRRMLGDLRVLAREAFTTLRKCVWQTSR